MLKIKVINLLIIPLAAIYIWFIHISAEKCESLRQVEMVLDSFLGRQRDVAFRSSEYTIYGSLATIGLSFFSAVFFPFTLIPVRKKLIQIIGTVVIVTSIIIVVFGAIMLSSPDSVPLDEYYLIYYVFGAMVIFSSIAGLADLFPSRNNLDKNELLDDLCDETV